ncbi:hypothetical protein BHE74_00043645 [Ensete ventricosum]|nr:hypothetical protein GW17_00035976 [Ensete ventricosum]RWW50119.1 hypothetical protein BHE74_00043645 [Ensete ventricosum]RZR93350.1 hypothetical protein BHM03_00021837 [Ensete ventricosum]
MHNCCLLLPCCCHLHLPPIPMPLPSHHPPPFLFGDYHLSSLPTVGPTLLPSSPPMQAALALLPSISLLPATSSLSPIASHPINCLQLMLLPSSLAVDVPIAIPLLPPTIANRAIPFPRRSSLSLLDHCLSLPPSVLVISATLLLLSSTAVLPYRCCPAVLPPSQ